MSVTSSFRIAYCTIASANYLGRVQHFLETLQRHQPNSQAHVLLCESDEVCRRISRETGHCFLSPQEVLPDLWRIMAFQYELIEFNTATKPFLIEYLLNQGFDGVLYFDPDIAFYGSLGDIEAALQSHDVVLTPHACAPVPLDGCHPAMADYLRAGQFNLGFVGLAGSTNGRMMISWWKDVCRDQCIFDPTYRFFVDQFWAAGFASFAERLCVFRHPGANLAYWNLFQRTLAISGTEWIVDGRPLLFFHFSGLSLDDLTRVSRYQNRISAPCGTPLHQLLSQYAEGISRQAWTRYRSEPYSFAYYENGQLIRQVDRKNYRMLADLEKQRLPNPFAALEQVQKIIRVVLNGDIRTYMARVRFERHLRLIQMLWSEFMSKLRSRGLWVTLRLAIRFVWRQLSSRFSSR